MFNEHSGTLIVRFKSLSTKPAIGFENSTIMEENDNDFTILIANPDGFCGVKFFVCQRWVDK